MNIAPEIIEWQNRAVALDPCAVIAFDEAAVNLAEKLLRFDDESLGTFQGASAGRLILIVGKGDSLPWTDGAVYLGKDERTSASFLLPTTVEPKVSIELFKLVLEKSFGIYCHVSSCQKNNSFRHGKKLSRAAVERWLTENK